MDTVFNGWLNQFAQFLNWVQYELAWDNPQGLKGKTSAYEPVHLHFFIPDEPYHGYRMWHGLSKPPAAPDEILTEPSLDLKTLRFVLNETPSAQTLTFSGWGEPLAINGLFDMIRFAKQQRRLNTHVVSHGLFRNDVFQPLLTSGLDKLTINMIAHKPSAFAGITRRNAHDFLLLEKTIEQLILVRQHYPESPLQIEVAMLVDLMSVYDIPEMIGYAAMLGVDSIVFENHLGTNPYEKSLHTLYNDYGKITQFISALQSEFYPIHVTWPTLLSRDPSSIGPCLDPFTTVSLNDQLEISPCSRHLVYDQLSHTIWNPDYWQNHQYEQLRRCHDDPNQPKPVACQFCPKAHTNQPAKPSMTYPLVPPTFLPEEIKRRQVS